MYVNLYLSLYVYLSLSLSIYIYKYMCHVYISNIYTLRRVGAHTCQLDMYLAPIYFSMLLNSGFELRRWGGSVCSLLLNHSSSLPPYLFFCNAFEQWLLVAKVGWLCVFTSVEPQLKSAPLRSLSNKVHGRSTCG